MYLFYQTTMWHPYMTSRMKSFGGRYSRALFDIDNTMAPYDLPRPDASAIRLFQELTKMQFKYALCQMGKNESHAVQ